MADLTQIQGDILLDGLPKVAELFYFFKITDVATFRAQLPSFTDRFIVNVQQQQQERLRIRNDRFRFGKANPDQQTSFTLDQPPLFPIALTNIAFSRSGLQKIDKNLVGGQDPAVPQGMRKDTPFEMGMQKRAFKLNDPGKRMDRNAVIAEKDYKPDWLAAFTSTDKEVFIDGVIIIAGSDKSFLLDHLKLLKDALNSNNKSSMEEVKVLFGKQRDKFSERKNEHFGFLDGVSEPWITGVDGLDQGGNDDEHRSQCPLSEIVCQSKNDTWALNGSYMVFRYLVQKVPEFRKFCDSTATSLGIQALKLDNGDPRISESQEDKTQMTPGQVLAARMVGRWPNGIPLTLTPPFQVAKATAKIDFHESSPQLNVCPYAAHVRKTNPRNSDAKGRHIMRRGIQFGDELRQSEINKKSDFVDTSGYLDYNKESGFRGLLFACYQSDISNGFEFMQRSWCNFENFPFTEGGFKGIDPLIGQVNPLPPRSDNAGLTIAGMKDPGAGRLHPDAMPGVNEMILPAGGEYFFSPSIKALKEVLGKAGA